jgi:hypothetical protein
LIEVGEWVMENERFFLPARDGERLVAWPTQSGLDDFRGHGRIRHLGVLPTDVVNAADRGPVSDRAVWSVVVVVLEPVWQGGGAVAV